MEHSSCQLEQLRNDRRKRFGLKDFTELSMGMSGHYTAIKEGSTMVRVGDWGGIIQKNK